MSKFPMHDRVTELYVCRAIKQLYTLTNYYSFILLSKAENAILEVTPAGKFLRSRIDRRL
jgi:hypothetical protein